MASILIVEDRPIDRKLLATVLASAGHRVLEATDGADALRSLIRDRPDLVISDILMPTMDGYELVRQIRETPDVSDVPVIFYSATYHEREAKTLARQCGVAAILTKPCAPATILTTVRAVLDAGTAPPAVPLDRQRFDREHLQVVSSTLAARIAELEAGQQRMAAVVAIAQEVIGQHTSSARLTRVCSASREVTLARHALLGLLDDSATTAAELFASGFDAAALANLRSPEIRGTPLETVVGERRTVRMVLPEGPDNPFPVLSGRSVNTSLLAVPLATSTRVYGWLALLTKLGAKEFTDEDEMVASTLAAYAAIAYENSQLYDAAQRHTMTLRDAKERTDFALAAARMGIWDVDLSGGRVTWSDSLAPLFGLTPEQAPRTQGEFFALIHPDDRRAIEDALEKASVERSELSVEFRAIWPDGSLHWNASRARVLFEDGRPVKLLGIGIDIGHQKQLEEQFRQAQKMEAVGQLAGGVAHDFNNLLTAVLGNANLLQEEPNLSETVRDEITEIVKAAERAAGLTRQLLAFGRKQVMQPTIVDLNALVADMGHMLRRLIGEHIQLAMALAPSLARVRADASQLEQVILNLAINARDAMPTGGRLSIETANVDIDDSYSQSHVGVRPGKYVMLAVSDTGTGMDEETKIHLFEPFFTTKDRTKGTGLGLATVYGIVKQSNGYIWVNSEKGHGSSFKVYLPVAGRVEQVDRPGLPVSRPARGSEMLLVVEDEPSVRQLTKILLEKAGYRVVIAANAQEAAELFQRHGESIALLITDVVMPGPSGPALLRHLSEQRHGLKVLYMSGYADDAVASQGALDPGAAFLQKPFTADRLVRKVREALER
jgi:PAS domain S-box-containing protein